MKISIGEYSYSIGNDHNFFWSPKWLPGPPDGPYEKCWAVFWFGLVFAKSRPGAA